MIVWCIESDYFRDESCPIDSNKTEQFFVSRPEAHLAARVCIEAGCTAVLWKYTLPQRLSKEDIVLLLNGGANVVAKVRIKLYAPARTKESGVCTQAPKEECINESGSWMGG